MKPLLFPESTCSSRLLAATLLDAWLSGDRYRLISELEQVASLSKISSDSTECDRMEILSSIASEMQTHSDLFMPRTASARIGVWIDLLDHLSDRGRTRLN